MDRPVLLLSLALALAASSLAAQTARAGPAGADAWSAGAGSFPAASAAGADWRAAGRILRVGPGRALKTPSQAAAVARDRDRIRIDAGVYRDCAIWRQNDLFIEGVGGVAEMCEAVCAGQAIWLIRGDRIALRNLRFSGARAPAGNGAGIKFTGSTLSIANAQFADNENGLLTGPGARSRLRIAHSDFRHNGACRHACAHGIYAGHVASLTVNASTFFAQRIGHHIKSRAERTVISASRIEDGDEGTASYAIDLPNAGVARIRDNVIQKGPLSDNTRALIAIGAEGASNTARGISIAHNRFVSHNPALDAFIWNAGGRSDVTLRDNRFEGPGARPDGPARNGSNRKAVVE